MSKTIAASSQASPKLTTPQLLKGGLYLTWGASLLLLMTTISGVQGQRHAIKTVGEDAVPSIVIAQRIKDALAGMDAYVANELLVPPGQNQNAIKGFEERRQALAERLVIAAKNITYGDAEQVPITNLQLALGDYMAKIQQARDFHERSDPTAILRAYRAAAEILDQKLLPAADELDKANSDVLNRTYTNQKLASLGSLAVIEVSGLLVIGMLVVIQLFLYYRMRRILNPMLLAATAIIIIFLGYTTRAILSSSFHLKVAKEDAFESMHALRQARALVYSANGDESRYLLDPALASTHEQIFFNKVDKIAHLPAGQTFETVVAALAKGQKVNGFTGYLGDELNNITFPGEQAAAIPTLSTFGTYLAIDKQIRQLQQAGRHQEAIALCVGDNPGYSNWAFNQFLKAHQKTFDINQQAFDDAIKRGFNDVDGFEISTPVVVVFVALLTLFGLLPRLKEYTM